MLFTLFLVLQAGPADRAWIAAEGAKQLTLIEKAREGYGAPFVLTTLRIEVPARGEAKTTVSVEQSGNAQTRPVTLAPALLARLLGALSSARPGKSVRDGAIVLQKSDTSVSVEIKVRSGDGKEAVFFTGTADRIPVEWRLRTAPDQSIELSGEELDRAGRELRARL
jgi:hypothetical protein